MSQPLFRRSTTEFLCITIIALNLAGCGGGSTSGDPASTGDTNNADVPNTAYATADLAGTWSHHRLQAGVDSKWSHGIDTAESDGNVTPVSEVNSGANQAVGTPFVRSISADGTVTESDVPTLHGTMSTDKTLIVMTRDAGNGDPRLIVNQKHDATVSFVTADLEGTWVGHRLQAGTNSNWNHNIESWDANGVATPQSELSSSGSTNVGSSYSLNLAADGTITDPTDTVLNGTMSDSKDLVVLTRTAGNGDPRLVIYQRQSATVTFTTADLEGTWVGHRLQSGSNNNWNYNVETWTATGLATETSSNGTPTTGVTYSMAISSDGIITDPNDSALHGTMSADKDLIVVTRTAGNGDPRLVIYQRR